MWVDTLGSIEMGRLINLLSHPQSGHITQGKLLLIGRSSGVESLMIDIASKKSLPAPQIQGIYDVCLSPDEQHVASHAPGMTLKLFHSLG